ncbi:MAG TPA: C4-dicarboxylate ABC transporter, partial [Rhodospirillales bacterium]
LPKEHQAILKYGAEAANSANFWLAMDQYSKDLLWLRDKAGVKLYRTPAGVGKDQLDAWDKNLVVLDKDPFFKKVHASMRAFSHRVAYYELLNAADYKQAFDHYFPGELGF